MGEQHPFTGPQKGHGVVTDDIPASHHGITDFTSGPRSALGVVAQCITSERDITPVRCRLTEGKRRPRGCILLVPVMRLDDFYIKVRRQGSRCLTHKFE